MEIIDSFFKNLNNKDQQIYFQLLQGLNKSVIIAITDVNGEIQYANEMFCEISGYKIEELIGKNHRILKSGHHDNIFYDEMWSTILSGKVWKNDICNKKKNGEIYWVKTTIVPLFDIENNLNAFLSIRMDITKEKEQESVIAAQLVKNIQFSRMANLGEMAGGIAHEINNPLSVIIGKTDLLQRLVDCDHIDRETVKKSIEKIYITAARIAKVVKALRYFSGHIDDANRIYVKLSDIIEQTVVLCFEKYSADMVDLQIINDADLILDCVPDQISQVLLNLLSNSFDAIKNNSKKWIKIETKDKNNKVKISITDSGNGINHSIQLKMMDPFFTTKEVGNSGLGLSIAKGIIEEHKGKLYYDSTSENTRFIIELPKK